MFRRAHASFLGCALALQGGIASSHLQATTTDYWCGEQSSADDWAVGAMTLHDWSVSDRAPTELAIDPDVAPAQMLYSPLMQPPAMRPPLPTRTPATMQRPALRSATAIGLASVPYMIGDTGAGSCIGFDGLVTADLAHPTLACSRLNISEANSPLPTDRVYWSYRHFQNASRVSAYQFNETVNLDQHTLAWENTFWDRTGSLEIRVPIQHQMQSDIYSIIAPSFGVVDPLVSDSGGREVALGNVSAIFKMLLTERETFALSGGVGFTLPTARDVNYQLAVDGQVEFPNSPGVIADEAVAFQSVFANETVYISPFLAWAYAPPARWFHQGFFQVEVAANPSRVTVNGDGATLFLDSVGNPIGFYDYYTPVPVRAELFSQTLMRLNLGWGYIFSQNQNPNRYHRVSGLFELHYTSTLQDANLTNIPLTTQSSIGTVPLQTITIGNQDNRVDILNAATGVSIEVGNWVFTNGVVAPIQNCCGFDFEYNTQVQRRF
ncbi:hypothetical protein [Lacipirellula parvula]|uniref:Uncharacterized protein n=1 Tax=Lacipirellula parvula TaxID=2650471 RepID=A0A5K7XE05_9BACT|nr:hypothetical protein [Lacipirellula parvula]BBO34718.1 hypothetical protein PLANPX_4330 [Lacipirellula parvula]